MKSIVSAKGWATSQHPPILKQTERKAKAMIILRRFMMIASDRKRRRSNAIFLVFLAATSYSALGQSQSSVQAHINGVLVDRTQAIYQPPSSVSVRCLKASMCGNLTLTKEVSEKGEFSFVVPPGPYRISATVSRAFPYRRATVNVTEGEEVFVRITPRIQKRGVALNVAGLDIPNNAPPIHYEEVALSKSQKALVEFETKKRQPGQDLYEYAVLTIGNWSVSADNLKISSVGQMVELDGRPLVYCGDKVSSEAKVPFSRLAQTPICSESKH
jgi:hypothetical protein